MRSVSGSIGWTTGVSDALGHSVNPSSKTSQFSYDAANRQTGQANGDGITVATTFDNANRPTEIKHQDSSGTTLAD